MDNKKRIMRGGEKGKNNSVNFEKSKNEKFEILIIGFYFQYFKKIDFSAGHCFLSTLRHKIMSASEVNNDGRETMWDTWNRSQRNNHDHQAAVGEFLDNSISWGDATKISIFIQINKIIICDNGDFNRERFPETFTMGAQRYRKYYDDNNSTQLGKYNCGITESTMILGKKCKCMHRFGNDGVRVTSFDIDEISKTDVISPNDEPANAKELEMFDEYIHFVDADENKGTLLIIDCIETMNIDKTRKYIFGLYKSSDVNTTLFDMTRCSAHDFEIADKHIIEQKDQLFDQKPTKKINIYAIETKGDVIFHEKIPVGEKILYKIDIETYNFSDSARRQEKDIFNNSTDEERVGFIWFRGNRRISGIKPLRYGLTTGMNRGRGLRIHVQLPINEDVDKHFKIGTQKKMTNESWDNFDKELQKKMTEIFTNSITKNDTFIKSLSEKYVGNCNSKIKSLNNIQEFEKLEEFLAEVQYEENQINNKQYGGHDCIKKKAGKKWEALCSYKECIENRIAEIKIKEKYEVNQVDTKVVVTKFNEVGEKGNKVVKSTPVENAKVEADKDKVVKVTPVENDKGEAEEKPPKKDKAVKMTPVENVKGEGEAEEKPPKKDKAVKMTPVENVKGDEREKEDESTKVNEIIFLMHEINEKEKCILRKKINLEFHDLFQLKSA
jgi:hypothetical protein